VLTEVLHEEARQYLAEHTDLVLQSDEDAAAFARQMADAQGVIVRTYTQVNDRFLAMGPKLKVIGRAGVGMDNFDFEACKRRGLTVVYTPAANTQAVVEYVWAMIFDAVKPLIHLEEYVPPPVYHGHRKKTLFRQLNEMTLGVLGMGRIGRRVAEVGRAIGMRVVYNDIRTRRELELPADDPSEFVDKATLWKQADILSIHVDGRPQNRHLINADVLGRLKPSCLLVNAARGTLVDSRALAEWAGRSAAAGGAALLDVQDPEPPPDDYPLFGLPNVKLMPHLAARTATGLANMAWVVRDVVRVLKGEKPQWPAY
jgi:phosphoglycerate dehydrogenase-like enzyme